MEKRLIYFDYAATTSLDSEVLEKMLPYYKENYGNADSLHAFGRKAQTAVDYARDKVAELIGAKPSEIYFTSGGTESDNWAVLGGAYACKKRGKTHVLASAIEHHAVLSAMERLGKEGFEIEYIPVNQAGRVEVGEVEKRLKENTGLVVVMKANNETGAIQPVEEIAELCKKRGILCFSDCVQYVPHRNLDVTALGADMVAISAHKFHGPKGCGVLYIRKGVGIEKLVAGGEQERGMRGGTLNVPAVVGLAHALELCYKNNAEREERISALRKKFLDKVLALDGVSLNGGFSKCEDGLSSVINLRFDGVENTSFLYNMDLNGIAVASGSACASASLKPSHVLTAMGLTEEQAKSSIRFSIGKDTTDEEIEYVAEKVKEILEKIRVKK